MNILTGQHLLFRVSWPESGVSECTLSDGHHFGIVIALREVRQRDRDQLKSPVVGRFGDSRTGNDFSRKTPSHEYA
jgi:hypothetical protein